MLEWTGSPFIDTLEIPCGPKSHISIVFLVDDKSKNSGMICSASASSLMLRDDSGVKVDAGIPLVWCT